MTRKVLTGKVYIVTVDLATITGVQDETGALPVHLWPAAFQPKEVVEELVKASSEIGDVSLDDLMGKYMSLLYRETRHLMGAVINGKLGKDDALAMRENLKLIMDLKKKEAELLASISNEELKKLLSDSDETK